MKLYILYLIVIRVLTLNSITNILKHLKEKLNVKGRSHEVGSTFWCHLGNQKCTFEVQIKNAYALLMVLSE